LIEKIKAKAKQKLDQNESLLLCGSIGTFAVQAFGAAIAFVLQIVLARVLGVESFGNYTYVWSWVNVVALVGTFGFKTASVKYVSKYVTLQQWSRLRAYLAFSRRVVLGVSILLSLVCVGIAFLFVERQPDLLDAFAVGMLAIPVLTGLRVGAAEMKGLKHVVWAVVPEKILAPICLIGGLLMLTELTEPVKADWAMGANITVLCGAFGLLAWILRRRMPRSVVSAVGTTVLPARKWKWIYTARDMLLIGGFHLILFRADVIMIGALISPTESGLYNVASRIANVLSFTLFSVNSILSPMISDLYSEKNYAELQRIVKIAVRATFFLSAAMAAAIFLLRFPILHIFGEEFLRSSSALWPLLIGQLANAFAGPSIMILNMTDRERTSAWILGTGAVANIFLNVIFIQVVGFQGAAAATMTTMIGWNVASIYYVKKKLGVNSAAFDIV
jgi:O-antigen/teichoic acid export membrane protein